MGHKNLQMAVSTKANILMEKLEEPEHIYGQMDNVMMDNGWMVLSMDQVCGEVKKVILIRDNGNLVSLRAMECIHGQMVIPIKENLKNV